MEILKRIIIFICAIFCCGFGIAVTTQAQLGTSPISSFPYVLSLIIPISFGTTTFIINMLFLLSQILILQKDFKKRYYLQILVTLFFGIFIDLGMHIAKHFQTNNYIMQLILVVIGSAILALGVTLQVKADIMYVPGEGIVKAVSKRWNLNFGKTKIAFDVLQCIIAIGLSLIFLHSIQGLREGTILSALLVGNFICLYSKLQTKITKV